MRKSWREKMDNPNLPKAIAASAGNGVPL